MKLSVAGIARTAVIGVRSVAGVGAVVGAGVTVSHAYDLVRSPAQLEASKSTLATNLLLVGGATVGAISVARSRFLAAGVMVGAAVWACRRSVAGYVHEMNDFGAHSPKAELDFHGS